MNSTVVLHPELDEKATLLTLHKINKSLLTIKFLPRAIKGGTCVVCVAAGGRCQGWNSGDAGGAAGPSCCGCHGCAGLVHRGQGQSLLDTGSVPLCWGCGCRNSCQVQSRQQCSQTGVLLSSHHVVIDMGAHMVAPCRPPMAAVPFDTLQGGTSCQLGPAHGTKYSDRPSGPPEATVHNLLPCNASWPNHPH